MPMEASRTSCLIRHKYYSFMWNMGSQEGYAKAYNINPNAVHGQEPLPILDASEVQEVRKELIAIRDKVNTLLDAIDGNPKVGKAAEAPPTASSAKVSSRMAVESTTAKPAEGNLTHLPEPRLCLVTAALP